MQGRGGVRGGGAVAAAGPGSTWAADGVSGAARRRSVPSPGLRRLPAGDRCPAEPLGPGLLPGAAARPPRPGGFPGVPPWAFFPGLRPTQVHTWSFAGRSFLRKKKKTTNQ